MSSLISDDADGPDVRLLLAIALEGLGRHIGWCAADLGHRLLRGRGGEPEVEELQVALPRKQKRSSMSKSLDPNKDPIYISLQ